jgi:SSS family transporter
MENLLTKNEGILLLVIYGMIMIFLSFWISRKKENNLKEFLLANKKVGIFMGAMSIASSWIWAPALFLSSQKAYEQGLAGFFWFLFPNILALIVFAPLGLKIRKVLPNGFTFPQYIKKRHGGKVHILYLIQFLSLQIFAFAVQILAGASIIHIISGLSFHFVALLLVGIVLIYSAIGGLRASIVTDYIQMSLILFVSFLVAPWILFQIGDISVVSSGMKGVSGEFGNIFNPWVFYSFGIPTTIGLLAGPIGDQMHWQRAYALKRSSDVVKVFTLAGVLFALVPLSLSLLGFVAAAKVNSAGWVIADPQMVGPVAISYLLPNFVLVLFSIMLISGLVSTLDSIFSAFSSLSVVDLWEVMKNKFGFDKERGDVKVGRISMIAVAVLGTSIAFIPEIKILHLFLFYGTLRASTLVPTIFSLFWGKLSSEAVFWSVLLSLIVGAPMMAVGNLADKIHLSVWGSILTILIGVLTCYVGSKFVFVNNNLNYERK